jgi:hypothetical protein
MLIPNEMQVQLRSGVVVPRWLVWIAGTNRDTGETEAAGFCNDADEVNVVVDGEERQYFGAGAMLSIGELQYEAGSEIQYQRVEFAMVAPEVETAIQQYDPRLAPVEIHLALFDPDTGALVNTARAFSGWVEDAPIKERPTDTGSVPVVELNLASSARAGTKTLSAKKSPYSQRLRDEDDRGRDYADMAKEVKVRWGQEDDRGYFAY